MKRLQRPLIATNPDIPYPQIGDATHYMWRKHFDEQCACGARPMWLCWRAVQTAAIPLCDTCVEPYRVLVGLR